VTGRADQPGTPEHGAEELAQAFEAAAAAAAPGGVRDDRSLAEAEDCVQEAWLRLLRVPDPGSIRDLAAWLTTTVSRLALDALGSARGATGTLRRPVAARTTGRGPERHRPGRPGDAG